MNNTKASMEIVGELSQQLTKSEEIKPIYSTDEINAMEVIRIENTPFSIIKNGKEVFGCIGDERITEIEIITSEKELKKFKEKLIAINWDRLCQVIWAMINKQELIKKLSRNE